MKTLKNTIQNFFKRAEHGGAASIESVVSKASIGAAEFDATAESIDLDVTEASAGPDVSETSIESAAFAASVDLDAMKASTAPGGLGMLVSSTESEVSVEAAAFAEPVALAESGASIGQSTSFKAFFAAIARAGGSNKLLLCSFAGNFTLCSLGLIAAPAAYRAAELAGLQRSVQMFILAAGILSAILFVSVMGYFAQESGRNGNARKRNGLSDQLDSIGQNGSIGQRECGRSSQTGSNGANGSIGRSGNGKSGLIEGFAVYLKRSGRFAGCFICAVFVYSLLCGIFSVLLYLLMQNMVSYATAKIIINLITCVTTLAVAPLVLMELFAFTFFNLSVKETLKTGLEGSRREYKRILLVMAGLVLPGGIFSIGISYIGSGLMRGAVTLAAYTLFGGMGTYVLYRIGIEAFGRPQDFTEQDLAGKSQVRSAHEEGFSLGDGWVRQQHGERRFGEVGHFAGGNERNHPHEEKQVRGDGWVRQIFEDGHSAGNGWARVPYEENEMRQSCEERSIDRENGTRPLAHFLHETSHGAEES